MKKTINRLWPAVLFLVIAGQAIAQKKDSLLLIKSEVHMKPDSFLMTSKGIHINTDSIYVGRGATRITDSHFYRISSDTMPEHKTRVYADSIYKRKNAFYVKAKALPVERDSVLYRKNAVTRKLTLARKDSVLRKQDALFRKTASLQLRQDSLKRLQKINRTKAISKTTLYRLDSLKTMNKKKDTARIRVHLEKLKSNLIRLKQDTAEQKNNMRKKIISMELGCEKNSLVSIGNMGRQIILKNTAEEKVKVETTIWVAEGFDDKEVSFAKVLPISLKKEKNEVQLRRTDTSTADCGDMNSSASTISADPARYKVNNKTALTIYVPASAGINIESRYNDVTLMDNVMTVNLDLINSNLQMQDAEMAVIKSQYGSIKAGTIRQADIDLVNCNFVSGDLEKLQMNSSYSTVRFESSEAAEIKSVSDQYKIANANYITANKLFGKLDIAKLQHSIVLTGSSADIDIRSIDPSATLIQVDNRYAAIKFPVETLPNYHLQFDGANSNIFPPLNSAGTMAPASSLITASLNKTVGDMKKDFTSLLVNCPSCLVDLR